MTKEKDFRTMLAERQKKINSLVCVGLDPLKEKVPPHVLPTTADWRRILAQMINIVDYTAPSASLFKPQVAHYESVENGRAALQALVDHIHTHYPDIPVFLDCKRGDIGRTQARYQIAHFQIDGVDGMNFSPYMGKDCMEPLFDPEHPGRAIVGLCYTSNPSARQMQNVKLEDGRCYWEYVAQCCLEWAVDIGVGHNAGLVMAAAHKKEGGGIESRHLRQGRVITGDELWYMVPGVGTQGGFVEETVAAGFAGPGSMAINSSSGVIFAGSGLDYAEKAALEADKLRDQCRAAGGDCR